MKAIGTTLLLKAEVIAKNRRAKRLPLLLLLGFSFLFITSCRTCKCPAYSEVPPQYLQPDCQQV